MAAKAAGPLRGPSRGSKLTIGFGLVNVEVKYAPLVKSDSGRASAKTCCRTHEAPVQSEYRCTAEGELVERADKAMLYEVDGRYVEVDTGSLGLDADKRLELTAAVSPSSIDPLYFEKAYAVWPTAGQEQAFDLIAAVLRTTGKALVGTTAMSKATRAIVIRWSDVAGCLLAHTCTYDERIAWDEVQLVKSGQEKAPAPNDQMVAVADTVLAQLADEFDFAGVTDEYAAQLLEAIEAAADGKPAPARKPDQPATPTVDLMAALQASVQAAKAKPKRKKAAA